jgi:hypothetical protein
MLFSSDQSVDEEGRLIKRLTQKKHSNVFLERD